MLAGKYTMLYRGDPGLFGALKKLGGSVLGTVGKIAGSPLGTVASFAIPGGLALKGIGIASKLGKVGALASKVLPKVGPGRGGLALLGGAGAAAAMRGAAPSIGRALTAGGVGALGGATLGTFAGGYGSMMNPSHTATGTGGMRRRYRRMNPLNAKAARRAIRRIKAVRKLTRSIESQLPKRAVRSASPFARRRRRAA